MTVFITDKINALIDQWQAKLGLQRKEGLAHAVLMLALTDEDFMKRAAEMSKYLGDLGEQKLENMGL